MRFALLAVFAVAPPLAAQSVVTLRAGAGGRTVAAPGTKLTVPVVIDMAAAAGGSFGSVTHTVTWGTTFLGFDSVRVAGFGSLTSNTSNVASGSLTLSSFDAVGTNATVTTANLYFTATATTGGTTIALTPSAAGDAGGANILPITRLRNLDVCVSPNGLWGDVNGDQSVNITDAQQVARAAVGLSVANAVALAAYGDVNADAAVNVIDAQQIARFSVALPSTTRMNTLQYTAPTAATFSIQNVFDAAAGSVNPGVPANVGGLTVGKQAQVQIQARDAGNVDITSCATMAYASSAPGVASVSSTGLITALSAGSATITVTSGLLSANVNIVAVYSSIATFNSITTGARHTCGLSAGVAYCWGWNALGQLGDGSNSDHSGPAPVATNLIFNSLRAGGFHTCGVTPSGAMYCWGYNFNGQLGDGTNIDRNRPVRVSGSQVFSIIGAGGFRTCAITTTSATFCWGWNLYGQLGDGTAIDRNTPTAVAGAATFAGLSLGYLHTCAVTGSGVPSCWGYNANGELGDGTTTDRSVPTPVSTASQFFNIAAGAYFTCGLTPAGAAQCWGINNNGQIGDGTTTSRSTPTVVGGARVFAIVTAGNAHACGRQSNGAVFCWGDNSYGQLGDATVIDRAAPTAVTGGINFTVITAGAVHTCGIASGGTSYCWGSNDYGQLGDGTTTSHNAPATGGIGFIMLRAAYPEPCAAGAGCASAAVRASAPAIRLTPTKVGQ